MAKRAKPDSDEPTVPRTSTGTGDKPARAKRKASTPVILPRKKAAAAPVSKPAEDPEPTDEEGGEPSAEPPIDVAPEALVDADAESWFEAGADARVNDFLLTYFKDLTRLTLLSPASEYELARRIGIMEEVLWVQVLSHAPLVPHLLKVVEQDIGKTLTEFADVLRAASELAAADASHQAREAGLHPAKPLADAAGPVAAKLRQLDLDRVYITSALEEIKEIDQALKSGQDHEAIVTDLSPASWQIYVQGISVISQLIQQAKDDFVTANLRLVVSIARRFNYGRMPFADLIQEGNVGLIKAVERFDYRRGFRFSTYAAWWIRHAISRGLADKGRVVRLPIHTLAEYNTTLRARRQLTRELGRTPTHEELATQTGLRLDKIAKMDTALLEDAISLDREVSDKDHRSAIDFLQDEDAPLSISERLISDAMLSEVQSLLAQLSPMEADILRLRFGLDSDQELTLKEIGDKYNLSRERIRQIQEQALGRMRRALARKDLI